jgi:TonB family protein
MAHAHAGIPSQYQQPLWGAIDPVLKRCFIAAGILGVMVLIAVFVAPALPPKPNALEDMPDRLARLILEKPKAPTGDLAERIARLEAPKTEPRAEEKAEPAKPKAEPRRRTSPPRVETDRGAQGRQKAKTEVAQNLAQVTGSVDKVLESVSRSLPASTNAADNETAPRRRRNVRSGRSGTQIAAVGGSSSMGSADMGGSAIESKGISIAAITDLAVDGGGGSGDGFSSPGGGGSADAGSRNDYRSNESLLAVVRRYAPGIQFCYDNELKRNPGLRGKLVVNITVLADGSVSEAIVVEDKLGSPAVTQCVVAQIRGWRFPAIPSGTTSFKTPFVFTPPS